MTAIPPEFAALAAALEDQRPTRSEPDLFPTRQEVLACQFSSWYPIFSNLPPNELKRTNVTLKSIILDLPASFRGYMVADGVRLPTGAQVSTGLMDGDDKADDWSSDSSSADEKCIQPDISDEKHANFSFPDLDRQIEEAIEQLGGSVIPKLNWSCPKDSVWMNSGTLKCHTPGDVYLLIKSSDFCSYDVHHALEDVQHRDDDDDKPFQLQLALRKWCNLYPSQEFRCFVRNNYLVAISQRQSSQHYPHLVEHADHFEALLVDFFTTILAVRTTILPENYVFDAYVDKKDRVWLVDLNVWGSRTDALLFSWAELTECGALEMRVVETERQVQVDPLSSYKAPIDAIHVAGEVNQFENFMKQCQPQSVLDAEEIERQQKEMERLNSID